MTFQLTERQAEANRLLGGPATYILLRGGARSGKTFLIIRAIVYRCLMAPGSRHAVFRFRFNHLKHSVIFDTFPKVMRLCFEGLPFRLSQTDWYVEFPNESKIVFAGLDEKDRTERVLGTEYASVLLNEISQISYSARNKAITRLAQKVQISHGPRKGQSLALKEYCDANPSGTSHWSYKIWMKGAEPTSGAALANPVDYATIQMNPADNRANISDEYIAQLETLPEKDRRRFLMGEFSAAVDNALWTQDLLDENRIAASQLPDLARVVVAVDPSGGEGPEDKRADEVGIVVAGVDKAGIGYVLEDLSGHYGPEGWARAAITAYDRWSADKIVAERNFGGAMVESTIRTVRKMAPVKLVTASRGKSQRAEPIAALYEQRLIKHLGVFVDLEDELCNFSTAGYQGEKSPNRGDSLVWAATELMVEARAGIRVF